MRAIDVCILTDYYHRWKMFHSVTINSAGMIVLRVASVTMDICASVTTIATTPNASAMILLSINASTVWPVDGVFGRTTCSPTLSSVSVPRAVWALNASSVRNFSRTVSISCSPSIFSRTALLSDEAPSLYLSSVHF